MYLISLNSEVINILLEIQLFPRTVIGRSLFDCDGDMEGTANAVSPHVQPLPAQFGARQHNNSVCFCKSQNSDYLETRLPI
jgi:hypothetical protein